MLSACPAELRSVGISKHAKATLGVAAAFPALHWHELSDCARLDLGWGERRQYKIDLLKDESRLHRYEAETQRHTGVALAVAVLTEAQLTKRMNPAAEVRS